MYGFVSDQVLNVANAGNIAAHRELVSKTEQWCARTTPIAFVSVALTIL